MDSKAELFSNLAGPSERRKSPRYTMETIGVSFDTDSGESRGVLLDLSESGMAVHTAAAVELGSIKHVRWELPQSTGPLGTERAVLSADKESGRFSVEFWDPSGQTECVETEGAVVWVDAANTRFGIMFQNLPEAVERSIARWIKHHVLAAFWVTPQAALPVAQLVEPSQGASQAQPHRDTTFDRRGFADGGSVIPLPPAIIVSPGHISKLPAIALQPPTGGRPWKSIAAGVALLALVFLGVGAYWGGHDANSGGLSVAAATTNARMLRLAGSNTIGTSLAPALAQAFLKQLGARDIRILPGAKQGEESVQGILPGFFSGGSNRVEIQIAAHGSATAFDNLMNASCDIGMASRKIKPKEISQLSSLGDMSSPAGEHLLALDGIAVIVSSSNPLQSLTKDQLAGIFSGTIVDWSQVSAQHGTINLYAPDNKSGTYDTFKTLVIGGKQLAGAARRLEDSRALSDAVAADRNGIGFVGMPFILNAKAIAIAERGTAPFLPNRLTVGTEDYPLSRRLYLYTPANSQNGYVRKFVEFALSKAGQDVVGEVGFIAQNVTSVQDVVSPSAPPQYRRLTQGAGRLSLDFRFLPSLTTLDSKALADLDRVVSFLADSGYSGDSVMLLGFTDNIGDRAVNIGISQSRARIVAKEFEQRGLRPAIVKGFGPDLPVGSNDSDTGRERNRRVEIWLKETQCAAPRAAHDPA
jgi:phosphate transport system substrate-binding protein